MTLKPITKKELQELKSVVDKQILNQQLNKFVEEIRSSILFYAQKSTKTSYSTCLYYSSSADSVYIENKDDIKSRLIECFPDSKVELLYKYELLNGHQITLTENQIQEPYNYKWLFIVVDWS
jgi:hypothetical protein